VLGSDVLPDLGYLKAHIEQYAHQMLDVAESIPGAQAKVSLDISPRRRKGTERTYFLEGDSFILKIQSPHFPLLPENEDLMMHLAADVGISVPEHTLLRLADRELAYLVRRFDRGTRGERLHQEDFAQASGVTTEYKYNSTLQQVARLVLSQATEPRIAAQDLYTQLLFSFVIGNNDQHLKNFSFQYRVLHDKVVCRLTPAYDLLAGPLSNPKDKDEVALPLMGRKYEIRLGDWQQLARILELSAIQEIRIRERLLYSVKKHFPARVGQSYLPVEAQERFTQLYQERLSRLA
jgi:serine/threonine-protein kinase HipA